MSKIKLILKIILNLIIFSNIIITLNSVYAIECVEVNNSIECKIPIRVNIETKKPIDIIVINKKLNEEKAIVEIKIINQNPENKILDLYSYAYFRNKCLSCNKNRTENIKQININKFEEIQKEIKINLNQMKEYKEFKIKIKYKENNKKTWKDITINFSKNEYDDFFSLKKIERKLNITFESNNASSINTKENNSNIENNLITNQTKLQNKTNNNYLNNSTKNQFGIEGYMTKNTPDKEESFIQESFVKTLSILLISIASLFLLNKKSKHEIKKD